MPSSRSRKSMYETLASVDFAASRLIENKGKHSRQFRLMDEELQNQFKTLCVAVLEIFTSAKQDFCKMSMITKAFQDTFCILHQAFSI